MRVMFKNKNNRILVLSPTRLIVSSFVVIILAGTILLNLPIASNDGKSIGFFNALFTATSASCVTGLVIADTLTQWSLFGQLVILSLVQIGGLGLATLATFFSVILGRKVALREMILAKESINYFTFEGVARIIKNVVIVTFAIELIGALLLSISFVPRFGTRGFYVAVFHAISAFCNAGFDIMGGYKSLTEYSSDPIVLYTVAGLVIIGGLGFMVWKDLYEFRKNKSLYLHTKVVLVLSLSLIIFGAAFFLFFEHNNPATMGGLTPLEKISSAIFHSVSTRTAGYNSLSLDDMKEISKVATIIFMFIGASPGSTGGGVKVTTFGVILMAIISQIKGSSETIFFKRRVPYYIVNKALSIIGLSVMLVVTVTTILLAIEGNRFINILYEVTSAFGTVGLSTGITPTLHSVSKALLILTMFLGRVGPLTFAIALTLRANKKNPNIVYPEGKIVVG
ncbi:trk system potassium uptake protein TrkH [Anaerobacterium chartisolvens]|uniref:Trk system potassium uptake protein TrkH n=2 Tax=Anaerobacterium chartisolvens TaxID=1297424 RepID=A0A369B6N5_9FIRM|nr:trk system potassium uptake protein TrkH [Anaerobacterium chartisolvens]